MALEVPEQILALSGTSQLRLLNGFVLSKLLKANRNAFARFLLVSNFQKNEPLTM